MYTHTHTHAHTHIQNADTESDITMCDLYFLRVTQKSNNYGKLKLSKLNS